MAIDKIWNSELMWKGIPKIRHVSQVVLSVCFACAISLSGSARRDVRIKGTLQGVRDPHQSRCYKIEAPCEVPGLSTTLGVEVRLCPACQIPGQLQRHGFRWVPPNASLNIGRHCARWSPRAQGMEQNLVNSGAKLGRGRTQR